MKQKLRRILGPVIIAATIGVFIYYLATHPKVLEQITNLDPLLIIMLVLLYGCSTLALMWVLSGQLMLYGKRMSVSENYILNAYSSLINFFGPGQSGPGFRAVYLKAKYSVKIKQYVFATLLYYGCYAVISAFFICVGSRPWWQTLAVVLLAGIVSYVAITYYSRKYANNAQNLPIALGVLFVATLLQLMLQAIIYGIELRSIDPSIGINQIITYTGVANTALFVSITPGAIGIRESFLVFTQSLHGIAQSTVLAASVIDRALYIVFLGALFVITLALHAKRKLHINQADQY